jgi:hypothetical protein
LKRIFVLYNDKFLEAPHVVAQLYGVPHAILQVFIIILYGNVFQNPELFPTQVSLSPEQSTLEDIILVASERASERAGGRAGAHNTLIGPRRTL